MSEALKTIDLMKLRRMAITSPEEYHNINRLNLILAQRKELAAMVSFNTLDDVSNAEALSHIEFLNDQIKAFFNI